MRTPHLPGDVRRFVASARRGTLATVDDAGRPRLVPICFVLGETRAETGGNAREEVQLVLYSAIDEKPKRSDDPMSLARVHDLLARPDAAVLVDRWAEDWERLAWVRLECRADVLPADRGDPGERARSIAALRAKYPQYATHRLEERPIVRLTCTVGAAWGNVNGVAAEEERAEEPDVEAM